MTAKERLIEAYTKLVIDGKATISDVPKSIRNEVAIKVAEMTEN